MIKCLGRGAWPQWEEALRVAGLHWRRKISKGQEVGLDRGGWLRKIKANSGSTPGNLSSAWTSTHCETFPLGKSWKPSRSCQQQWGWLELQRPGRKCSSGESWWTWALVIYLITSKEPVLQGSEQARTWLEPGLAEQGQEKPILQLVGWVTTGVHRLTACTGTKSTGQCFSLGSGFHLKEKS